VRGRIRTASGAAAFAAASSASSNRLSDCPSSLMALAILRPYPGPRGKLSTERRRQAGLSTGFEHRWRAAAPLCSLGCMPIDIPPQAHELLTAQGKAIARYQGMEAGLDPRSVRGKVSSARWQRLQRGVYAAFSGDPARETMLWAALLRAGPDAVLSHQTAAERHGLIDTPAALITITVPASKRPARVKIPGILIHRSDAILRTRHPAMLPPCTRVEDTVLDLIQIAPTFDDAYVWICRAIGRRRTTAERIRKAMDSRKKIRWRRELTVALGDADDGVLSWLEYRYVHRVERPHGLPAARRQARIRQRTGNKYLDNLYEEYGVCVEVDGPPRIPRTSSGVTSGATTPTWPAASSRSGSASPNWAIAGARARLTSPRSSAAGAGPAPRAAAPAPPATSQRQLHG